MWIITIGGPARTRAKAEVALECARVELLPPGHHGAIDWSRRLPQERGRELLTVLHGDVDEVANAVRDARWTLVAHHPLPPEPEPTPEQRLHATIAEMRAEIAALKARIG